MEAHILAQKERAREIVNALYQDLTELTKLLAEYMAKEGHLRVPDGVLEPINQFQQTFVISTDLRAVVMAIKEVFPTITMRALVQGYNEVGAVGPIAVVVLYYGFYPKYNSAGYKLPHAIDDPHHTSEFADLVLLCQRAYAPAECDKRDELVGRVRERLAKVCKKGGRTLEPRKVPGFLLQPAEAGVGRFAEAGCSVETAANLVISDRGTIRVMAAKSKWEAITQAIAQANPRASIKTISNIGRVPWDIRQESLLVKIDSRPMYKLYNNQDYELIPFVERGVRRVHWLVEVRCIALEIYLFSILNEVGQVRQLENELAQVSTQEPEGAIAYSGVYFPVEEYETALRLAMAKHYAAKRRGGAEDDPQPQDPRELALLGLLD